MVISVMEKKKAVKVDGEYGRGVAILDTVVRAGLLEKGELEANLQEVNE